ncbi:alkyl hydroperoxide reductase subunit F [Candidatus Symbiobacter mobilis]|uniref:Alkyl hydroperoxide reductase subunit F n=1 Tax=Candidatus Symbiobacter mobilis CR TaxID=946483 RepID=U5N4G8_9BURK|nr:alkyl hydroperoxide reductase subunit F [Candidatus Symbiobacter mobilis]AGX86351.1 alkyl hydroperoxide reductase subunit F [Candidatus Symbiobacter mobilis CR]
MLDETLSLQLQSHLTRMREPVGLVASLDDSAASRDLQQLLEQISQLTDKIAVSMAGTDVRRPSFQVRRAQAGGSLTFAAIPLGHEFTSLVLALLWAGGHPPKVEPEVLRRIEAIDRILHFEVYVSLSCHNCPDVVQALSLMALRNPRISATVIDGALFPQEAEQREVMAVPTVLLDGEPFSTGRISLEEILEKLAPGLREQAAAEWAKAAPFDVLVVGGGPAGAAAAVYAARKGIRTAVVAERFGGQVNDTVAIENFVSVLETDGAKFAAALEAHVRAYEVPILHMQRVERLLAPEQDKGLIEVGLSSGTTLRSRTVILCPGARWRNVNVPGEQKYRNKGVAYCPHCDGPLFRGKRVAVIGGGNSGVEAAIDLAGITAHVTLIEFDTRLRADAVLVQKLQSLPNVAILTHAQTTEITGDGSKVNGLSYLDRSTQETQHVPLEGVFVQIGLVPNTDWLRGTLELSRTGEIVVDTRGQTSLAGVFAAGDASTSPFKQIIIATGDGAKAALSAFDYLVRM